jgi:hypothetical protein
MAPMFGLPKNKVLDCTVFAFLEAMLGFPVDTPLKAKVLAHANLVAYRKRIRDRWWKDLKDG